ncbi:DUF2911 domain-containing protein [Ferruginibacter albus]|uniref:DUF2911 domain-containing protein n=1 Tax=Ferruginibacter albus TaxID=2875540 RepID=UPI001CC3E34A|nr:DUF2911 domain-containing protein [Ferruginibacter albus]UAY51923.1 DUF2911 domain-containing protein [Ferruginibacter albus]
MKKYFLIALVALSTSAFAQEKFPALDKSPMDMSYCPANYPGLKAQGKPTDELTARVIYSRPQKNGRAVFDSVVEAGKVWRVGANEATEIDFYKSVTIGGKKVAPGRYTLYAIPTAAKWTIIISKQLDVWGAYSYDEKQDVVRTDAAVQKPSETVEALSMLFVKSATGSDLVIAWDNEKVALPIAY